MPIDIPLSFRWVRINQKTHIVYERDGDFSRTMCGEIIKGGTHSSGSVRSVSARCSECMSKIRIRNKRVRDE